MIKTWDDFKTQFKRMYLIDYDEEDLWEDLRRRTQGEREKVSAYLTSLRYIVMQFRYKPKVDRVVYRAYRNLRPEYRRAFAGRISITLDEIEEWGIRYEKMKDLDCRWEAPPNAENMHVPGAACQKPVTRGKGRAAAAAVSERSEGEHAVEAAGEWQTASGKNSKKKGKGKGNNTAGSSGDEQLAATVQTNSAQYGAAAKANSRPQQNNWRAQGNSAPVNAGKATGAAYVPQPQQFPPLPQPQVQQAQLPRPQPRQQQQQQGAATPEQRGAIPKTSIGEGAFFGACRNCTNVGHRASECPLPLQPGAQSQSTQCYRCQEYGHTARQCTNEPRPRAPRPSSPRQTQGQLCKQPGVELLKCPNCLPRLSMWMGNEAQGGQM